MSTGATRQPPPGPDQVALVHTPGFWVIVRYAILFGVVLAFAALAFLTVVTFGTTNLFVTHPDDLGWFGGSPWWVAVTAGAGLLVGLLRHVLRVPEKRARHGRGHLGWRARRAVHGARSRGPSRWCHSVAERAWA